MSEALLTVWECPECGARFVRNYRHIHSTSTHPYSRRVELVEKLFTEVKQV